MLMCLSGLNVISFGKQSYLNDEGYSHSWLYLIRTGQSVGTWLAKAGINSHTAPIPMLHAWITHRGNGTAQFHMLVHFSKPDQNVCPFLEQKLPYNIPINVIRKAAHSFRFDIWTKLCVLIDYICMMYCM